MTDAGSLNKAEALRSKLVNLGYKNTIIVDSRTIPTLWCCFHVVMVDRFENEADAKTLSKKLSSQGIKDIMVKKTY